MCRAEFRAGIELADDDPRVVAKRGQGRFVVVGLADNDSFGDFDRYWFDAETVEVPASLRRSEACVGEEAVVPPPPPGGLCGVGWRRLLAQPARRIFAWVWASSPTGWSVWLPSKSKRTGCARTAWQ